jgi:hypothetical protein
MASVPPFVYDAAFDRNIGWLTEWEQQSLRHKKVAIAGMGGVGGIHLVTLARLGIGAFNIADLDSFDIANMNRQAGAMMSTMGRPKVDVLAEMAHDINPELRIRSFPNGVTPENTDDFLRDVDLFVDGFDFFVLDIRRHVYARCHALGIPAICAAPIGIGTGYLIFRPGGMSFETYFRMEGQTPEEQYLRFLLGLVPRALQRSYLVDDTRVDLAARRGPSTVAACQLCAGVTAAEAVKVLLNRGRVRAIPFHNHFDAYKGKLAVSWLPFGAAGPIQTLKRMIARRFYMAIAAKAVAPRADATVLRPIEEIVSLARWTPSGDNVQPWRFQIVDDDTVSVALSVERDNPYEYRDGEPTILAGGMMLESLRIAASAWGRRVQWSYQGTSQSHRILVRCTPDTGIEPDPLCSVLPTRSVRREPFRQRRLSEREKHALAESLGPDLTVEWFEALGARLRVARLGMMATDIRLRMPEAFAVHRKIVDWDNSASTTGIPAAALGLARWTLAVMRWGSRDWRRMRLLNSLGGTLTASLQMDVWPAVRSGAMFAIRPTADGASRTTLQLLKTGERLQRFWLTCERLGLGLQPALATLIFADYGAREAPLSRAPSIAPMAIRLARKFTDVLGAPPSGYVFIGRVGERIPRQPTARSVRRPLPELVETAGSPPDHAAMR